MRWPAAPAAVLVFLVLTGAPATAETPVIPPDAAEVIPTLAVPWPHVGDAGSYSRTVVRMSGADGGAGLTIEQAAIRESFLVEPSADSYDGQGVARKVVAFRTWFAGAGLDIRHLLDAEDGDTVATTVLERSDEGFRNWTYFGGLDDRPPLCGLRNALQGAADPGLGVVALQSDPCRRAYYGADGGVEFVRVREDPWGDGVAVGFQQTGLDKVVLVWFTSEIPYPVRMLEELEDGAFAVLDLTHFQRGQIPASQGRSGLPPLPPLRLADHLGVGADESGTEHPFPWSDAWAVAKQDPNVDEFLASHPRAIVRSSGYNFGEGHRNVGVMGEQDEDVTSDAWYFVLDDGAEAQKFVVRHVVGQRTLPLPIVGGVETEPIDEMQVEELDGERADPTVLVAPQKVPTVASTLAWWEAFATKRFREEGANGWMTFLSCGGCDRWRAVVGVGRLAGSATHGETTTTTWEASYLLTNSEGAAFALAENVKESDYGRASAPVRVLGISIRTPLDVIIGDARERLPDLQQGQDGWLELRLGQEPGAGTEALHETTLSAETSAPSVGGQGSRTIVVGATAAAAAGVAGLAWLVKALLVPLFSRVRRESALDNPVRATLLDLVEAEHGIHLQELVRRTGRGAGTVRHHLAKLEDVGLVKSRRGGGFLCYFPTQAGAAAMAAAGVTKSDGARRVLAAARAGGTAAELARRTGLAPGTVDHHLARLAAAGIVRRDGHRWLA